MNVMVRFVRIRDATVLTVSSRESLKRRLNGTQGSLTGDLLLRMRRSSPLVERIATPGLGTLSSSDLALTASCGSLLSCKTRHDVPSCLHLTLAYVVELFSFTRDEALEPASSGEQIGAN